MRGVRPENSASREPVNTVIESSTSLAGAAQVTSSKGALVFVIEALTVGGAEQMLVAMANQLCSQGWPVHMVCLSKAGELAAILDSRVELHVLEKSPGFDHSLPGKLRKLIGSIQPMAVNCHLWTANTWTRVSLLGAGHRIIATEHSRDTWKSTPYRLIDRLLASQMQTLVAVSSDTADFYMREIGVPQRKVAVINNGIETARFRNADGTVVRAELATDDKILVGTVGRMIDAKNHPRLVQAVARIRDQVPSLRLVFVGDGPERKPLEAAIVEHGVADITTLTGTRSDVPEILKALDIFVLSSDREGHPLTALEAQAAGTPVVLTNAGGSADAIVTQTGSVPLPGQALEAPAITGGILVEKSVDALADALLALAQNESLRREMGVLGSELCENSFDQDVMVSKYLDLFVA